MTRKKSSVKSSVKIRQSHGGALVPGAGGGRQPGSGRPPEAFRELCRSLISAPAVATAVRRILKDSNHAAFIGALKWATEYGYAKEILTSVSPEVLLRLEQQAQLIASKASWDADELLARLDEIWK